MTALRAVIADDERLLRDAIANLLRAHEIDVVAEVGDAHAARRAVLDNRPDIAVIDIRMPPTHRLDGLGAAVDIRAQAPEVGILLLSQHLETQYVDTLLGANARGVGYLLKDRVAGAGEFVDAVRRVAEGDCVIDPDIVRQLLRPVRPQPANELTDREREVLALMAEGRSNQAICAQLHLSPKTVETHIRHIFTTLGIAPEPDYHRRVLAVLAHLGIHR
jgi:DNA-binding NarL/FixJ family response regulator